MERGLGEMGSIEWIDSGAWKCTWESSTRTPPGEPTLTEQWEYCVGGEPPPADLLKQEQLDTELMRIGRHEHMKQLDRIEKEESVMLESSSPTLRTMFVGKRSKNTKKKSKKEHFFFERGEWREGGPETSHYFR